MLKRVLYVSIFAFLFGTSVSAALTNITDYYTYGVSYFQKGDYQNARVAFETFLKNYPNNENARYYLAQCYIRLNKIGDARTEYNKIIMQNKNSQASQLAQKGLVLLNQKTQSNVERLPDNYLVHLKNVSSSPKLWEEFPISVFIPSGEYYSVIKQAFDTWVTVSAGFVKFTYVNSQTNAQIIVNLKYITPKVGEAYVAGLSKPYTRGPYMVKSEIEIHPESEQQVYETTLHEIGHSLGIDGHSPEETDIMYRSDHLTSRNISPRDINTLKLLYTKSSEDLRKISSTATKQVKEDALNYAETYPHIAIAWTNLAAIYLKEKDYKKALDCYNKASAIEPEVAENYNLIGDLYARLNNKPLAYKNYKKACDLDLNNDYNYYKFIRFCFSNDYKHIGKKYLIDFLKNNPSFETDEKFEQLKTESRFI